MTTLEQAARQALEALENRFNPRGYGEMDNAITALREALEQPCNPSCAPGYCYCKEMAQQPKQEPDKLGSEWTPCVKLPIVVHVRNQRSGEKHISTREGITPVNPDDLIMRGVAGEEYPIGRELWERTYTTDTSPPPQREWVGLTDEDMIADLWLQSIAGLNTATKFARAIEAKLKEKNT